MRPHYRLGWVAARGLSRLLWGFRELWQDEIPLDGPLLIASNHISNWDPIFVGLGCPREMHFLAKQELFVNPLLARLIRAYNAVPVRRGMADRRALRAAIEVLDRNGALLVFPEGTRSTTGEIGEGKPGVGYLAAATGASVVPAYIEGSAALRDAFTTRKPLTVAYGERMEPPEPEGAETHAEYTARVMERIRGLKRRVESS